MNHINYSMINSLRSDIIRLTTQIVQLQAELKKVRAENDYLLNTEKNKEAAALAIAEEELNHILTSYCR